MLDLRMGSIPGPGGVGPASADQETFAVGAYQINGLLFELVAPVGWCNVSTSFRPRWIHERQLSPLQQTGAIRSGPDEAEDPSQA